MKVRSSTHCSPDSGTSPSGGDKVRMAEPQPTLHATRHDADDARSVVTQARREHRSKKGRHVLRVAAALAVVTAAYVAWVLVPIYVDDYSIQDACRDALRRSTVAPFDVAAFGEEEIRRTIPKADFQIDRVQFGSSGAERVLQVEYTRFVGGLAGLALPMGVPPFD